jgi:ComF family protein
MVVYAGLRMLERIILPATCILCGGAGQADGFDLCAPCASELPANSQACLQCGEQLDGANAEQLRCGACLQKSPRYQATHCAFRYSYPVDHLVRALKYHGRLVHARVLGQLLAQSLVGSNRAHWPELLIPVPLSERRFVERGFNQAIEIAKHVSRITLIPMRADLLERRRATQEQAGLDRIARRKNVRAAFVLRESLPAKHVAILDDVVTTGSTVNEIARVLKRAGAQRIEVWAVARASR